MITSKRCGNCNFEPEAEQFSHAHDCPRCNNSLTSHKRPKKEILGSWSFTGKFTYANSGINGAILRCHETGEEKEVFITDFAKLICKEGGVFLGDLRLEETAKGSRHAWKPMRN